MSYKYIHLLTYIFGTCNFRIKCVCIPKSVHFALLALFTPNLVGVGLGQGSSDIDALDYEICRQNRKHAVSRRCDEDVRGLGLGVEVGEFFDVQFPVAVLVELSQQDLDSSGWKAVRRILQYARRLVQSDVAVLVVVVFLELGHQLNLPANINTASELDPLAAAV